VSAIDPHRLDEKKSLVIPVGEGAKASTSVDSAIQGAEITREWCSDLHPADLQAGNIEKQRSQTMTSPMMARVEKTDRNWRRSSANNRRCSLEALGCRPDTALPVVENDVNFCKQEGRNGFTASQVIWIPAAWKDGIAI